MIRLLLDGLIWRANVVASVVIPINVAPNNNALITRPVLDIKKTGIAIPMDCKIIASTNDFTIPHFFASDDQMIHDGTAANPTIIQTKVASPLKLGVFSAIDTINVPVTMYPNPSNP